MACMRVGTDMVNAPHVLREGLDGTGYGPDTGRRKEVPQGRLQAMFEEEEKPKPKGIQPMDLDMMSIEALGDYIAELEAEIARVQAKIEKKQQARGAAESVFKF